MKITRTVVVDDEDDFEDYEDGDDFDDYDDFDDEVVEEVPQRALSTGTTVQVSNLDEEVTKDDIEELFSSAIQGGDEVKLKSAEVNYNREGKSNGTATVVFTRRQDALRAMQEYNGVPLDGKPMQLAMMGGAPAAAAAKPSMAARMGRSQASPQQAPRQAPGEQRYEQPRGAFGGRGRGNGGKGGRGKGGKGERKPREQKPAVSAEDLDAGLDDYFNN